MTTGDLFEAGVTNDPVWDASVATMDQQNAKDALHLSMSVGALW